MKELSIKQKAKAYDEALEKARKELQTCGSTNCDAARQIFRFFPELKESEDERIRKAIIEFFKIQDDNTTYSFMPKKDILAWLEKQGEKLQCMSPLEAWKDVRLEVYQQASGNRYEPNCSDDTTKMFSLNDIDEIFEKICEQKTSDKVEPKFKVGDWVVTNKGDIIQIATVNPDYYILNNGIKFCKSYVDTYWHLWTIEDAKEGSVLIASDKSIFIYAGSDDRHAKFHLALTKYGKLNIDGGNWEDKNSVHPATKEQRDVLFAKLKEEGYEWDAEQKKLKKIKMTDLLEDYIEQKPVKWTEEDEKRLNSCLNILQPKTLVGNTETMNTKWLKSLKERIEWKPSDEQLMELRNVISGCSFDVPILIKLEKKLKEL